MKNAGGASPVGAVSLAVAPALTPPPPVMIARKSTAPLPVTPLPPPAPRRVARGTGPVDAEGDNDVTQVDRMAAPPARAAKPSPLPRLSARR
jgi:hypothetical protein